MVIWHSGSALISINLVNICRIRLRHVPSSWPSLLSSQVTLEDWEAKRHMLSAPSCRPAWDTATIVRYQGLFKLFAHQLTQDPFINGIFNESLFTSNEVFCISKSFSQLWVNVPCSATSFFASASMPAGLVLLSACTRICSSRHL